MAMESPNPKLEKFEKEDLPKILAALHHAHFKRETTRVIVDFADSGGVVGITLESKKRFK